jgi:gliding motility-associated-like protein
MSQVLAVASGGTPPYSFAWITGDTTAFIDSLCAGKYTLWLKDYRGCKDTVIFEVSDTSSMEVTYVSEPATCYTTCDGSIQIIIKEAVLPCKYIWKTGDTTDFVDNLCRGFYDVSVKDAQRCTRRLFPEVPSPPPIVVDSSVINHPYCHQKGGGAIEVFIKGGVPPYTYYWDSVPGTNSLSDLEETRPYLLTVIDANGCRMDTALVLLDFDTLTIQYQTRNIPCSDVCNGSATVFAAGGFAPYTYVWTDSLNNKTSTMKNLCEGEYEVTAYDVNKCWIKTVIPVFVDTTIFPASVRAWSDMPTIYRSQSTVIQGSDYGNGFDYTWSPPDYLNTTKGTKATSTPLNTIVYTYKLTDTNGCVVMDTVLIIVMDVICEEPYIFVPNSFTPNGDGINDILYVRGNVLEKVDFAIYDRWGEKLFETKDKNIGWDGTFRGKPCDPGVYVYYLDATCIGGARYLHKGNVTVVR